MKRLLFVALLLLAVVVPSQAANYINSWPSGSWIYAQAVTEQNFQMPMIIHTQKASVTLSGPTGTTSTSHGFTNGTAVATVYLSYGGGTYVTTGVMEVYCTRDNRIFLAINASRSDSYGWSLICVQKSIPTCSTNPITGWVTCTYYPICDWPNCAPGTAVIIVGAYNFRYQYKKLWRQTASGLDCYGALQLVADSCDTCAQGYF
jgi:hypothetical protein